jgi:hypothetical protein
VSGTDRMAAFVEATAPAGDELHALLQTIACRLMEMEAPSCLARRGDRG